MNEDTRKVNKYKTLENEMIVNEDGSITGKQKTEIEYTQSARDFLTDYRILEKNLQESRDMLTKEFMDKVKKNIETMENKIKELKPLMELSEKKVIDNNNQQQINFFRKQMNNKDVSNKYILESYKRFNDDLKKLLTEEEVKKINKIMLKEKRKEKR